MNENGKVNIIDLDSMLHIVAAVQFGSGNRDNPEQVKEHIRRFYQNIRKSAKCQYSISFYQRLGHKNFRKEIMPEYKGMRTPSDAIIMWKPTIIEAFDELNAYGLDYIESDDAIAALAPHIGSDKIVITSSDKDMQQVAGEHYNPFKKGPADDDSRWFYINKYRANRFFWEQVLTADGTDMPLTLCGIKGVGPATASKMTNNDNGYIEIIQKEYTKAYGEAGLPRAQLTYQMVRLLVGDHGDSYAGPDAVSEIQAIIKEYKQYVVTVADDVGALFGVKSTKGDDLFK